MIKISKLIILLFFSGSTFTNGQTCQGNECSFPNSGQPFWVEESESIDDDWIGLVFRVNSDYYYHKLSADNSNRFFTYLASYDQSQSPLEFADRLHQSHLSCIPYSVSTEVEGIVFCSVNDRDDGNVFSSDDFTDPVITSLSITDITTNLNLIPFQINGSEQSGGWTAHNVWNGELLPGHLYRVNASLSYKERGSTKTGSAISYICIGELGNGNGLYFPQVDVTYHGCEQANITVQNDNQLEHYWSNSTTFVFDEEHKFDDNIAYIGVSGAYNVVATNSSQTYISEVTSIQVDINDRPNPPTVEGPLTVCACKTEETVLAMSTTFTGGQIDWYSDAGDFSNQIKNNSGSITYSEAVENQMDVYAVVVDPSNGCTSEPTYITDPQLIDCNCKDGTEFSPGERYVLQAWVSFGPNEINRVSYDQAVIEVSVLDNSGTVLYTLPFAANMSVVEGWRRMEHQFTLPSNAAKVIISFANNDPSKSVYFDDVRLFKAEGEMISYVYNKETLQLEFTLDKDNFYTKYIRNQGGEVIKSNVETTDGIRTVAESRSHIKK